jgi:hypothetical protein
VTDAVVPPLVYALAVSPLHRPAGVYADTWQQHTLLSPEAPTVKDWQLIGWKLPTSDVRAGGGTILRGSYFGLDVVLAETRLPRSPAAPRTGLGLTESAQQTLREMLVLRPAVPSVSHVEAALGALRRGRTTIATWKATPPARNEMYSALVAAGVDGRRANALIWTLGHQSEAASNALSLGELLRLGGGALPATWGAMMKAIDGCPCVRPAPLFSIESWRGSWPTGVPAAIDVDLELRLAEHLSDLRLPPLLIDFVRPAATADWIEHARQSMPDDWEALLAWPRGLERAQVEEYVLALVRQGTLVPPARRNLP